MSAHDRVQEFYERGVKAAREGRFMASDHFFQRAVSRAYALSGLEGRVQCARHIARIYKDLGLARMAARHYRRALSMLVREHPGQSELHDLFVSRLEELNQASLSRVLQGLGIISPGNGPVTPLERNASLVLAEVRAVNECGLLDDALCTLAAQHLNDAEVTTGKGGQWTARLIRDLCEACGT